VILPDELAEIVEVRLAEFSKEFQPATEFERVLVQTMAFSSACLLQAFKLSQIDMQRVADRAVRCWYDDRRKDADDLGAHIARDPARIAGALNRSLQGADWLIERWEGLRDVLESNGCWNDDQRALAFDLLGVAPGLRDGSLRVPLAKGREGLESLI